MGTPPATPVTGSCSSAAGHHPALHRGDPDKISAAMLYVLRLLPPRHAAWCCWDSDHVVLAG